MGMMDMGAMPQVEQPDPSAPMPQGMMGGQPVAPMPQAGNPSTSHGQFNGTIDVQGQPVEVKAGVAEVEGQPYMVSDDGAMVVSSQGQLVGHVENGKFVVITPEYHDQMMKVGFIQ
jgi:hypothetical protein